MSASSVMSTPSLPHGIDVASRYLDLAGVFSCALLGGAVARSVGLDLFGFLAVGIISGLGGGVIRDVLLQHGTPVALTDYAYLVTAVAGSVVVFLIKISEESWNRLFTALDAAVIGFWAVAGANKTLAVGLGWLPAVLLGTVTAVGGGALRDVILGRVPAVFGRNGLYATVAIAVAGVMVTCSYLGVPQVGIGLGIAVALAFRLTAVHYDWNLPNGLDWQPQSKVASTLRRHRTNPANTRNGDEGQSRPPKEPT
ncbi:trimeric intracellular cation channel family protein [Streptomyces brevispora]|uniref:Putative membrane protein YeiH n=1 Tax=Streptomyces brevispora TaxID=887462 RepID=A0A561V4A9_9ACTN|nr:trimeric intracellular cation channel family protein [Streptomyces brevispora]TWG06437.1 putative membrane protein YeiH [Streptomyces brevispora]